MQGARDYMMGFLGSILTGIGTVLCCLASAFSVLYMVSPGKAGEKRIIMLLSAGAVPLLAVLSLHGLQAGRLPVFGRSDMLLFYALSVIATYLYVALQHRMRGISVILVPYVTLCLLLGGSAMGQQVQTSPAAGSTWLGLHVCTAFIGFALCTVSGVLALAYVVQNNNLKRKHLGVVFERLPPLESLDHLMSRQIGAAFLMLTLSLAFGVHLARLSGVGYEWVRDPKVMSTIVIWGIYAVLVHMRTSAHRHGQGMALVTIAGFILVLLTFLGIHIFADGSHIFVAVGATDF
ncbi:MAG: cytochrome c biogenesis protein CcsA [Kiritimatiellia bacterium]|nr:cytochrome c biogenesis protein CcsA [Kiritimatiellia bacterium]